jgi:hypothetical protein
VFTNILESCSRRRIFKAIKNLNLFLFFGVAIGQKNGQKWSKIEIAPQPFRLKFGRH